MTKEALFFLKSSFAPEGCTREKGGRSPGKGPSAIILIRTLMAFVISLYIPWLTRTFP